MGWVFLEIAAALVVAVLIVWWTMPRKPRHRAGDASTPENSNRDA
ncbi:MAG TPA: hypothetical protein VEC19_17215 [Usitatibacter sp.]|nr:hypothetical protein [Usitatibacter sp.]